ncbi:hypothetical protein PXH59_11325 [Xenorhabdus sp. SF857]|uniref:hypothetical protein n=1 Tax=Xenorhabdus bakwenae TaxID=3026967 RepID=UPI0025581143|nr:hypothetical protein [Xenorhabdus sp. SF857]WFQ78355.1 hypothetical protein PXH59_11325 [Xenorhabdus sp. SF857]
MAGQLTVVPPNGNIIKGQPFSVVVLITNEPGILDTVNISVDTSSGVTLIKKFPPLIARGIISQQLIFQADDSNSDHEIKFTADSTSKPKGQATYHPVKNPDLNPDTCVLRGAAAYLYDAKPVELTGQPPCGTNPFVSASINPMTKKGVPISNYDIPLRATAPLRIFGDQSEIPPYDVDQENQYYYYLISKPSNAAVNLKIYATQGLSQFVGIETIFSEIEYNQKQTIFINTTTLTHLAVLNRQSLRKHTHLRL